MHTVTVLYYQMDKSKIHVDLRHAYDAIKMHNLKCSTIHLSEMNDTNNYSAIVKWVIPTVWLYNGEMVVELIELLSRKKKMEKTKKKKNENSKNCKYTIGCTLPIISMFLQLKNDPNQWMMTLIHRFQLNRAFHTR